MIQLKKVTLILIAITIIISLSACGNGDKTTKSGASTSLPDSSNNDVALTDSSYDSQVSENNQVENSQVQQSSERSTQANANSSDNAQKSTTSTDNSNNTSSTGSSSLSQDAPDTTTPQSPKSQIDNVNISLSPAPIEVSYKTKKHIYSTAIVNSYKITKTDTADSRVLCQVDFSCTKTFDEDGENGSNGCRFKLIIKKDNVIVGTECVNSDVNISVNQVFTVHWEATFTPENSYTIEICDYLI